MDRAAEIVSAFVEGKSFAYPHSAEEFLAMAYDDMAQKMREAQAYAEKVKGRYESAVAARAMECVSSYKEAALIPPGKVRPEVWTARLEPVQYSFHHMSAHPSEWDARFKEDVCRRAGEHLARVIFRSLEAS